MTERRPTPLPLRERDFERAVIDLAHALGWKVAHFRPARVIIHGQETWRTPVQADGAGFFDLVLVRPPRVLFVEDKSDKGKLTKAEQEWRELMKACPGVEVYVWRPYGLEGIKHVLDR